MQIYLYVDPNKLDDFMGGFSQYLYGYTSPVKGENEHLLISIPVRTAFRTSVEGEYEIERQYFADQF